MAYVAAIAACPAYTERFRGDLVSPPLRIPFPVDAKLFVNAVAVGREVIWVQAFGERFTDPVAGRPASRPRLPKKEEPTIPAGGAIPGDAASMPNEMEYDKTARRLRIGKGYVDNVAPDVWAYEVGGKQILRQWFSYRKLDRSRPIMGDRRPPSALGNLQPDGWLSEYTTDLIDVLHVLGRLVALEPTQADSAEANLRRPHDRGLQVTGRDRGSSEASTKEDREVKVHRSQSAGHGLMRCSIVRLLYRLSVSAHRDRFILKGAMLFVTWVADPFRPTRDRCPRHLRGGG